MGDPLSLREGKRWSLVLIGAQPPNCLELLWDINCTGKVDEARSRTFDLSSRAELADIVSKWNEKTRAILEMGAPCLTLASSCRVVLDILFS